MKNTIKLFLYFILSSSIAFSQSFAGEKEVDQIIQSKISKKKISGAVVLINHQGNTIHHKPYGYRDIDDKLKMDTTSIFRIYSMTKPITSLATMILVDQNKINLDDPIDKFLPELKDLKVLEKGKKVSPKRDIIVRDLLRHTSGFAYGLGLGASRVDMQYMKGHPLFSMNYDQMIDKLAKFPLQSQPGEEYHYSLSVDVLGAIIERVSKQSLYDFMNANIFIPLKMTDTHFTLPDDKTTRFTTLYGLNRKPKDEYNNSEYKQNRLQSGGGGLISTSSDYLKFCRLIMNKGIIHSDTLISPELIDEMIKNQLPEGQAVFKFMGEPGIGFGLGFSVYLKEWGENGHQGDFAWSGIGNTHFYCSPKEDLVVIIMTQKMPASQNLVKELKPLIYKKLN